jgi:hypothetical protein
MPRPTIRLRVIVLLPLLAIAAAAQAPPSNWDNVKTLAAGTQVRVAAGTSAPGASKPIVGTLESVTDNDLVLMQGTGQRSFPRGQIMSVSVKKQRHRVRDTFIGLGVGTAAGIAIGVGIGASQAQNCKTFLCGFAVPVDAAGVGAIGLVAGTLTGLFWPTGWHTVYAP